MKKQKNVIFAALLTVLFASCATVDYFDPAEGHLTSRYDRQPTKVKSSKLIDFTGIVIDVPFGQAVGTVEAGSDVYGYKMNRDFLKAIDRRAAVAYSSVLLEERGYDVYGVKDIVFNSTAARQPDIRLGAVVKNMSFGVEKNIDILFILNIPIVYAYYTGSLFLDIEWHVYDVKDDIEVIKTRTFKTYKYKRKGAPNPHVFLDNEFGDLFTYTVMDSVADLLRNGVASSFFDRDVNTPYKKFTSSTVSNLRIQENMWEFFSDDRFKELERSSYVSSYNKKMLEFYRNLKKEVIADSVVDDDGLLESLDSDKYRYDIIIDGKKEPAILLNSNSLFVVSRPNKGKVYSMEFENGVKVNGDLVYFDEKLGLAFVSMPVSFNNFLQIGCWDKENNSSIRVLDNDFSKVEISGKGKSYIKKKMKFLQYSKNKEDLDKDDIGKPVFDEFGSVVGLICDVQLDDDREIRIVDTREFKDIFKVIDKELKKEESDDEK